MTTGGIFVILLSVLIEPQDAQTVVENFVAAVDAILAIVGIALAYYGRYRQGDITWYGKKI